MMMCSLCMDKRPDNVCFKTFPEGYVFEAGWKIIPLLFIFKAFLKIIENFMINYFNLDYLLVLKGF